MNQPPEIVTDPKHYMINKRNNYQTQDLIADLLQEADIEPIIAAWWSNVIKYTTRWNKKGGIQDLYKTIEYINKMIRYLEVKSEKEKQQKLKLENPDYG